ncbi:SDR family oxidoreductase [Chitinophaga sancti]|uniref:SDR family oxidoreductase n=1 Tax=Chitinophaga sancti TaxID=1004 RepID=UPI002A74F95D|nr:SDR family oxidoreductase [Chitinophaga sancti]WPQ66048.1 SDR family oxidoreductase [Chitinophaga sancti]
MKILLTGSTGYIGKRLLSVLLEQGHEVYCLVRDRNRVNQELYTPHIIEADLLKPISPGLIPRDIDAAYYLVHSMSKKGDFTEMEKRSAMNFVSAMNYTSARQIIYLGGIVNADNLSTHLHSRKQVEEILADCKASITVLRAGIVVGSGSASFEIIRDLTEKLPVMIAPAWLNIHTQPIAIRNVIEFLTGVLLKEETFGKTYDLYGADKLTYKEMLQIFAEERGLKRYILTVPVMTPRLSSYWLYFVTSTSYMLARNLVDSMKVETVARPNNLAETLGISLINYRMAIRMAFDKIEQDMVLSTWKDALSSGNNLHSLPYHIQVPQYGCFKDCRYLKAENIQSSIDKIFSIGGNVGWYYADWLWEIRGFIDKLFGGVGLKRGRKHATRLAIGDSLDFWRVLYADHTRNRLLLYAEMKLPGEAWLEFSVSDAGIIRQEATFRPVGLTGRFYWYLMLPFHYFIFRGMLRKIATT